MSTKLRRFSTKAHGMITFGLGKRFTTKARAEGYAKQMRAKGMNARVIREGSLYAVYTRR